MRHIWIMRHGDAPYINGGRQISDSGHQQIKLMTHWFCQQLEQYKAQLGTLLVSPSLRAQQTADTFEQCFAERVEYQWRRETEPLLKSEANPDMVIPYVEEVTTESVLLISHMPLVSNLWVGWLKGESQYFPTAAIGGLVVNDSKRAQKLVFQSPEQL